ncbi:MAG: restriction endonuclease subunit M [Acidobacteria bacterium RIFCSPLOWO2_02_FULL_59_13]|nr:MAG: restriction endonuclease subunit M [Acidobacteria bacterium RIFCSPLOWO2_02_FULL_59_13]
MGRPPRGRVVRQNEYKNHPHLEEIFHGKSKHGKGDAYPDFLLVSEDALIPQAVIEAKPTERDLEEARADAQHYAQACLEAGHSTIAIGVAGQEKTGIEIGVWKNYAGRWKQIAYQGYPVSWIPTPADTVRLLASPGLVDLAPVVPRQEVLAAKADLINRILREATVKDEYRPAYVGAMMLSLWESKGSIRREPKFVLKDINSACESAFSTAKKLEVADSLHIPEGNAKLAATAWQILATLEKLNVVTAAFDHDYLGQLYETFFRYTGGNTIGQYFTPRHVTRFMADVCQTTADDIIIDPACGTGGFLISCIQRAHEKYHVKYEDAIRMVRDKLIGYEDEPVTAALCVANMILRGDGKAGIRKADCFTAKDYPSDECQVALMNPPFPHKKTDDPPQKFFERALEALETHGKLGIILPTSLLVKKDTGRWREKILKNNSLFAVCQMPDELFQPYASSTTSVVFIEKGVPHNSRRKTAFVRVKCDGLTLKKGTRVLRPDGLNQMGDALDAILNKKAEPGFSGINSVSGRAEWSPGAYIPSAIPTEDELKTSIDELIRRLASFYARYAREVARLRHRVQEADIKVTAYPEIAGVNRVKNAAMLPQEPGTIGELFDIFYGQKELHSREGIPPGESLVVSPTEQYNGCYGWLWFQPLIKPPFVTVAQTGSIGESFVQVEPCAVNDDCLILLAKQSSQLSIPRLLIAAATIRLERWRFSYGRKLTPSRICRFPMPRNQKVEAWAAEQLEEWRPVIEGAVSKYENTEAARV